MCRACQLLIVVVCSQVACRAQVDLTRPFAVDAPTVALFHLDDVATGQVTDAAGGSKGTVSGAVSSFGKFGGAVSFDGAQGWVDVTQPRSAAAGPGLTVECWAKFRSSPNGDILCRNMAYMMRLAGAVQAYVFIDGKWRQVAGSKPVPTGRWTHLAMTYDQGTKEVRTYVDGRLDVARVPEGVTEGKLSAGEALLRLGSNTWAPERGVVNGKLDEARISSVPRQYVPLPPPPAAVVLTETNLMANPSFEFGLQGWRASYESNTRLQWRIESGDAPHGRAFLRSIEQGGYSIITHPIAVMPGKVHTVSAAMRADKAAKSRLTLSSTGVPQESPRPSKSQTFDVKGEWQRASARFQVPEDWPTELACVQIEKPPNVTLDVDAVSLVVGERSDYSQTEAQSVGVLTVLPPGNTYQRGASASLAVQVVNAEPTERRWRVDYRIEDWLGQQTAAGKLFEGEVQSHSRAEAKLAVPTERVGWFTLRFLLAQEARILSETTRVLNVVEPLTGVGEVMTSPLGMNTHMEREPNEHLACNLSALSLCGVKWIRAWWGWGMAEKEPDKLDWTEYDRQLDAVHKAGMEIMPILLRYYPNYEHAWAGKTDKIQQPPYDLNQWAKFVETTVRHYRGRVKAWEVWNEPEYTMSPDYYGQLIKVTYERIKAADPEALVVGFGGVSLDFIRKTFGAGSAKCMDILSHHSYGQLGRPFEQMAKLAADTEALVKQSAATQRVWHSEQGSGADGVGYVRLGLTEEECAINLVQAYLSALATGVEKFFWFSAQTSPSYGWGVFYEDYTPRPRLVALNGVARLLQGRKVRGRLELGSGQVACVLAVGQAEAAAALWNLRGSVALELPTSKRLGLRDMLYNPLKAENAERLLLRLEHGRPAYVIASAMSASQLANVLQRAQLTETTEQPPVQVSARKADKGELETSVRNTGKTNLDLRIRIAAPDLFATPPEAKAITDLPAGQNWSALLTPDKKARPGASIPVEVTVEVGEHGIHERVTRTVVRF